MKYFSEIIRFYILKAVLSASKGFIHTFIIEYLSNLIFQSSFCPCVEFIMLYRLVFPDSKTRLWTFPVKDYFNCKKIISVLKPHVLVGDLPKCVIEVNQWLMCKVL